MEPLPEFLFGNDTDYRELTIGKYGVEVVAPMNCRSCGCQCEDAIIFNTKLGNVWALWCGCQFTIRTTTELYEWEESGKLIDRRL